MSQFLRALSSRVYMEHTTIMAIQKLASLYSMLGRSGSHGNRRESKLISIAHLQYLASVFHALEPVLCFSDKDFDGRHIGLGARRGLLVAGQIIEYGPNRGVEAMEAQLCACVKESLDNFLYQNAVFMCERLYAEFATEVSPSCTFCQGKIHSAQTPLLQINAVIFQDCFELSTFRTAISCQNSGLL